MKWIFASMMCGLALYASSPVLADQDGVTADKSLISRGQAVKLNLNFSANKVVASGGRFGKGTVVTGRRSIIDHPRTKTHYVFNVYYTGQVNSTKTDTLVKKPLHAVYTVDVDVLSGQAPRMTTYRDPHGWQINFLSDWRRDNVYMPDEGGDGQVYLQKELDDVERIKIGIMPVKDKTCVDIMSQIHSDMPTGYGQIQFEPDIDIKYEGVPAVWSSFSALDQTHPGTHVHGLMLAFVKNGRAYVISARTEEARYKARQPILETMVKSFTFVKKTASADR